MKRIILIFTLLLISASSLWAYRLMYAEQYYKLYHMHFYQDPSDCNENLFYLEHALKSPFVNPLNAMATIQNEAQWERYRYLFYLHVNLKMTEQYRLLASKYDKFNAYFYNYPWKQENLDSLEYAYSYYDTALYYWDQALEWADKLATVPYHHLSEVQEWEDELYRINTGELDYREFIGMDLERLEEVRAAFRAMDENTY
ncbi:MAG: hypothetical protein JEY99_00090 [Spirochaetales bacterium]|nr:hypothetical protein [Spirochaetales bacterium]